MKYLLHKFRSPANSRAYVDNWEKVFGEKELCPLCKHPEEEHLTRDGMIECLQCQCWRPDFTL